MAQLGVLPTVATLVGLGSSRAGFAVHMAISALVRAGFGLMVRRQRCGPSRTMFLGAAYGAWCASGPLTLLPLALGGPGAGTWPPPRRVFPAWSATCCSGWGRPWPSCSCTAPVRPAGPERPIEAGALARAGAGALAALALGAVLEHRAPAVAAGASAEPLRRACRPRSDQGRGRPGPLSEATGSWPGSWGS